MDNNRCRQINNVLENGASGPIVYWMSRDQRARDNWALLYAQREAVRRKVPLVVLFCFVPNFLEGTMRQYGFMLRGLSQVESVLKKRNIPFFFVSGEPKKTVPEFLRRVRASGLFSDFSPLRTKKKWMREVLRKTSVPVWEVDAHNIVPCWRLFSGQVESIEVFRKKLRSSLPVFLNAFPAVRKHPVAFRGKVPGVSWEHVLKTFPIDRTVEEVSWLKPGENEAQKALRKFLKQKIREYRSGKSDGELRGEWQWRLQPYLHFGQLSIQKVVWSIMHSEVNPRFKATLLETLITRRELADHFCHFNESYDSMRGFPKWARETLLSHCSDRREHIYSRQVLEAGETHDNLWNMIQMELVSSGRIFGFARRYWAKRLVEWTRSPKEALQLAISFTEKYSLNGWDPNGYLSIARAIGGVYEKPDDEHPVFGSVPRIRSEAEEAELDMGVYFSKG